MSEVPAGAQRRVVHYERVEKFTDPGPTWLAILSCGHERVLSAEPARGVGPAQPGRYMDCHECGRLEQAEGA